MSMPSVPVVSVLSSWILLLLGSVDAQEESRADLLKCPVYAETAQDILDCWAVKDQLTVEEVPLHVNPCLVYSIYGGHEGVTFAGPGAEAQAIETYEARNGLYPGVVDAKTMKGPGVAFSWVKGADGLLDLLRESIVAGPACVAQTDCILGKLQDSFRDVGYHPNVRHENQILGITVMDLCELHNDHHDAPWSDADCGYPSYGAFAEFVETEFPSVTFSPETLVGVSHAAGATPPEQFKNLVGCDDLDPFAPSTVCPEIDPRARAVYDVTAAESVWYGGETSACLEAYLGLDRSIWDSAPGFRTAALMCFDFTPYFGNTGMVWNPQKGFTSPEFEIPNALTVQELRTKASLKAMYVACQSNGSCELLFETKLQGETAAAKLKVEEIAAVPRRLRSP